MSMTSGDSNQDAVQVVPEEKLERLLRAYGVAPGFIEFSGNTARTPLENRLKILSAQGLSLSSESQVDRLLAREEQRRWADWMAAVVVVHAHEHALRLSCADDEAGEPLRWRIGLEEGGQLEGAWMPAEYPGQESHSFDGKAYSARQVPLPELPEGYHQLTVSGAGRSLSSLLIVAPERCHEPDWLRRGERLWGISVQLYALCSDSNWGMGDFQDLRQLIDLAARQGADFLLLNPLHALDNRNPEHASPYSPTDRRFLNPLYIHIDSEEDFCNSGEAARLLEQVGERRNTLRGQPLVDYSGVFELKYRFFELMYRQFQQDRRAGGQERGRDFEAYMAGHDDALMDFARCQARASIAGIECAGDPGFHIYLQWLAEGQLAAAQAHALARGMRVGLVRDLAVGGGGDSCEVATNPDLFCLQARIGAPPDNFNPDGQNWGLPPLRPDVLRDTRFAHFITLLRENMSPCGALRIDHVMALMRLWWCPTDGTNASGAYVHYPVDELFAILRLESRRAGCMVIGEDLGVVPPEIRAYLDSSGVLSNVIFYFEKYDGWHFKKPHDYPQRALAIVANHDVPTLKAWWEKSDLRLRRELGLITDAAHFNGENDFRQHEKEQVLQWLDECHLLPEPWLDRDIGKPFDALLGRAIFQCCASSPSQLLSVQLDDLAGMDKPVNIPGTDAEYPNWRRKIPRMLPALFQREDAGQLLAGLREARS